MQHSAIAGTRAEQPDADLGIPKGRQSFEKRSNRINAPLCVGLHKTIISNSSAEEFKVALKATAAIGMLKKLRRKMVSQVVGLDAANPNNFALGKV
jgi:hypothetical protein